MSWPYKLIEMGQVASVYVDKGLMESSGRKLFVEPLGHNDYYQKIIRIAVTELALNFDLYYETSDREEFKKVLWKMIEDEIKDAWEKQEARLASYPPSTTE